MNRQIEERPNKILNDFPSYIDGRGKFPYRDINIKSSYHGD